MLPIADVVVGDQVLAYNFDTGTTVARDVTATLPHTDWLLQAHLSDCSVMSVTEDHRFWSVTDSGWVELQDLDSTDQLLTPDGAMVTVDYLDWNAGADAPAWDLTVAEEHNFFVTAEHDGQPLLVHNSNRRGVACRYAFDADAAELLNAAEAAIGSPDVLGRLDGVLDELEKLDLADDFYGAIADVTDPVVLRRVLANSALGENVVAASISSGRTVEILGHPRFAVAARSTTVDNLATKIATRQDLSPSKIAGVRTADPDFAALGITDDVIIDRWWIYGGSKTQDQWLTAYATVRKNGGSGSQFEVDALLAAGVDGDKIYFDFSAVKDPGPVAGRSGFEPDDARPLAVGGGQLDPTDPSQLLDYWSFTEVKNLNPGPINAGLTSNTASQLEWLRRQTPGPSGFSGELNLYVGKDTAFTQPFLDVVRDARRDDVIVNLFREDASSPNGFSRDFDF